MGSVYLCVSGKPVGPSTMNISNNRSCLTRLLFIMMALVIVSCGGVSKVVYQTKTTEGKVIPNAP